ncbi:DUF3221 domain-containing protein [Filobacillus milosensis]|uniref:DUF3221 domain-containing protein n=1 Tax=Filobacillus milosensis TaxID=94137 RepID=UPI001891873A|nr:DUF3221 domain-containing protein [Filobacillus milosensis]
MALLFIVFVSVACTSEDDYKSKALDTLEGFIVDKRETDHEPYQVLVVPDIKKEDIENKSRNEREILAYQNDGVWYSINSKAYKDLKTGDRVKIYYNSNAVLESNPPQMWAEGVEVIVD